MLVRGRGQADKAVQIRVRLNRRPPSTSTALCTHRSPIASWCAASEFRSVVRVLVSSPRFCLPSARRSVAAKRTKACHHRSGPVTLRFGVATPKTPDAAIGIRAFVNSLFSESLVGTEADGQPYRSARLKLGVERQLPHARAQDPRRPEVPRRHAGRQQVHQGLPRRRSSRARACQLQERHADRRSPGQHRRHQAGTAGGPASRGALEHDDLDSRSEEGRHRARRLSLLERGPRTRLAAFPGFYRGKPKIDSIEIVEFEEQRASWAALMRGEIDAVHEILPSALDFLKPGQTNVRAFPFTRPYFISSAVQRQAPYSEGCRAFARR